jgi:hypothetical protein
MPEPVIRGASLISIGEAKGHDCFVDATTLRQVYGILEQKRDLKVKLDHESGVMSTAGYADNFKMSNGKILADVHIYESEPNAGRILEIANKKPHHLGLSLEFEGEDETVGGKCYARASDVSAVALVSDPAANDSLFEKLDKKKKFIQSDNMRTKTNFSEDVKTNQKSETSDKLLAACEMPESKMAAETHDRNEDFDAMPSDDTNTMMDAQSKDGSQNAQDPSETIKQLSHRLSQLEKKYAEKQNVDAITNPADPKMKLPATNPNAEPVAQNNGPTMQNGETGSVVGGIDGNPYKNDTGAWEKSETRFAKKLAAQVGIRPMLAGQAHQTQGKPGYQDLVETRVQHLLSKGVSEKKARIDAEAYTIKHNFDEYKNWRKNFESHSTKRTF